MAKRQGTLQTGVRMLAALALLFLSFAHQPVTAGVLPPQIAAAYVLPDGSIADICFGLDGLSGDHGHGQHDEGRAPFCEACRLAATALLPPPADTGSLFVSETEVSAGTVWIDAPVIAYARLLPPAQGPPVSL
ncbi:hypothetical protein [Pararhizobium antarcticum]|uniref:DUF2946 domain-containing protein n=1 Tax=Pararhizobium antarcticum TaxID=1798805 RepID=A0A657LNF3_9HYPH|nr:hypothetical protein [Pararhizobium antarcticum]OJF93330.1 hypothetical protein AX760_04785 [Pararhizobium antarcticum]OJF93848.1 hypothetical protein AX761_19555 [Rhizobium sp. 58]